MKDRHGYSQTPLLKKLGLKSDHTVRLIILLNNYFNLIGVGRTELNISSAPSVHKEFIHLFTKSDEEMTETFAELRGETMQNGMIWVS